MTTRAGQLAQDRDLVDIPALLDSYYDLVPDPSVPAQAVSFGTSGHRGSSFNRAFNEAHIAAITAAIVDFRRDHGTRGPIFLGRDTHALSEPAFLTVLEVLAAADVPALIDERDGFTPTPAVSHAVLGFNAGKSRTEAQADAIIVTPSHNPPSDGGIKYNPPHGGPAGTDTTKWIADRANSYLEAGWEKIPRKSFQRAFHLENTENFDFVSNYVGDLPSVIDIDAIRGSDIRIGADPLGGASVDYWAAIAEDYDLNLTVVHPEVDPAWSFMTLDWDEKIRMDCSSPYAMAGLIASRGDYDIATGNDADADRHGIVTPDAGLMNPNHYLATAIDYLLETRTGWPASAAIGKTLVTSSIVDRVVAARGRKLFEVPVGFKWFVPGLLDASIAFGGEESAGASFLRRDGKVWSTDKDGIILALLAAEMTAKTGKSPSQRYAELAAKHGTSAYARQDAPATREQKSRLGSLKADEVGASTIAGEQVEAVLTSAPGNDAPIGGLKVTTENAWFAVRPSGTEDVYKIYAESLRDKDHLKQVQKDARTLVDSVLG
ncbi:phosphoglucomutase [Brevibacterium sanguinis]|uniref:Phosphoglucomutase n=2 Tax=Brevibacterium TaxID=1696 RepID=A0A366IEX6_9MICO|nr:MULTISPECIES: phosphoglucomutase (alpha-D-glucose-1,6-bisphosphate-dependent) [Brevibacterium]RBP62921.1 phosphoglucomutase [Brevibacterium sanguinis]RBP69534.1 phosphoglucomutase [Brevibacterium celere]